ncbi:MAG: TIGR03915 family putative DNA repair protein, partial [Gemmatimonadaceae bacterium]
MPTARPLDSSRIVGGDGRAVNGAPASVPATFSRWRSAARRCLRADLDPQAIEWRDDGSATGLFGADLVTLDEKASDPRVSRRFTPLAQSIACHRDESRWSLLYELAWRMAHGEPYLLQVASDPLVARLTVMHRGVRRAAHKMKAFVRFRAMSSDQPDDEEFISWFEPAHRVVERVAPFFVDRFRFMRWSVLTPDGCARWDLDQLFLSDGIEQHQAPSHDDSLESLWKTYYAGTFNPARLNRSAMLAEMPARYWKNLPEAELIAGLAREAPARVTAMIAQTMWAPEQLPPDLEAIESQPAADTPAIEVGWHPTYDPGWVEAKRRARLVSKSQPDPIVVGGTLIYTGVAGWTDPTILAADVFYPRHTTTSEERLRYYASVFPMVEVDATYYSLPSEATSRRWVERTPEHFAFDIKAHSLMTGHPTNPARLPSWLTADLPLRLRTARNVYSHHFSSEAIAEVWARFISALEPLRLAGKLGAVMLQFPKWFTPSRESAAFLRDARDKLGDCPASVEFRHRDWLSDRTASRAFQLLRDLQFSYVAVDAPPGMESSVPPVMEVTNTDLAFVRLHGRRVSTWEARNDV